MTSQLDERPAQVNSSRPDRNQSPRRRRTWVIAAALIAVLMFGAGLVVAVALADDARSSAERPEQADISARARHGGGLPGHLQEFEARTEARSSEDRQP